MNSILLPGSSQPIPLGRWLRSWLRRGWQMMLLWTLLGALLGAGTGIQDGGILGIVSGMIAGVILLPWMGLILGLMGGDIKSSAIGAFSALVFMLACSAPRPAAEAGRLVGVAIIVGGIIGATFPLVTMPYKLCFAALQGLRTK